VFWTSDFHLNHANIIKYAERPFVSVGEMDDTIIDNTNQMVGVNDTLVYGGDWCFAYRGQDIRTVAEGFRKRINCRNIYYIYGNHDKKVKGALFASLWKGTYDLVEFDYLEQRVIACHFALRVWDKSHHGSIHLYGHSHASLADDPHARSMDVGVDYAAKMFGKEPKNYRPFTWDEIMKHMSGKNWKPVDHHGAD
jgi:calcineurin-like phosphoesterase family protein